MSSPDEPTRRVPHVPPAATPPPPPPRREMIVEEEDPWRLEIIDRLGSLRTGLMFVALLSVLALGLAIFTLLTAEEERDTRAGASRGQVRELEDRVDALERQGGNDASEDAVGDLRRNQQDLEGRVRTLEQGAQDSADPESVQQSIDGLAENIEQLDRRLQDVERRLAEQEQQAP